MNEIVNSLRMEAASKLRIFNIVLERSNFSKPSDFPDDLEGNAEQQFKRLVGYTFDELDDQPLLFVKVELGVRMVGQGDEPPVFVEIEADYFVIYKVMGTLSDEATRAFSDVNAVSSVWPFWRQHVFDLVQKGNLPYIEIPLYHSGAFGSAG